MITSLSVADILIMNVTGWELLFHLLSGVLQPQLPEIIMGLTSSQPQTEATRTPTSQKTGVNQNQIGQQCQKNQYHHNKQQSQRKGKILK